MSRKFLLKNFDNIVEIQSTTQLLIIIFIPRIDFRQLRNPDFAIFFNSIARFWISSVKNVSI